MEMVSSLLYGIIFLECTWLIKSFPAFMALLTGFPRYSPTNDGAVAENNPPNPHLIPLCMISAVDKTTHSASGTQRINTA
jgi:hypothetical protein